MASFAIACVKYLLFFFNVIFAIAGLAIVVAGTLLQGVYHNYSPFVVQFFKFVPILIISVGVVVFIIAFFGCCGTVKENNCMLSTFASLLIIVFIMEIVLVIGTFVFREEVKGVIKDRMDLSLTHYATDLDVRRSWDFLQSDLHCCGVNAVDDWGDDIQPTCCPNLKSDEKCMKAIAYQTGCIDVIFTLIDQNIVIISIIGIVVILVQLVGITFACCLAYSIRNDYETV